MRIRLYGMSNFPRCITAKRMLEKRNIRFTYIEFTAEETIGRELPVLIIDDSGFSGNDALMMIRELK